MSLFYCDALWYATELLSRKLERYMNLNYKSWFRDYGFKEAELNEVNDKGEYALILACQQGRYDLLQHLSEQNMDVDCLDRDGNNALWAACDGDSEVCCRWLTKHECELNYQNPAGNTVLAYAASCGKERIVNVLLQLGVNSNLKNQEGKTAMDLAANQGCLKMLSAVSTK